MPRGVYIRKTAPVPPMIRVRPPADRFWEKVDQAGECWLWTAGLDGRGYGKFQIGTMREPRVVTAHRFAYEDKVGPVPDGLRVLHKCDIRKCVRPDHLFLGTQADNLRDMSQKKRSTWGEKAPNSKLTEAIVLELRDLYDRGLLNQSGAARQYGVSPSLISTVVRRKKWTQLP